MKIENGNTLEIYANKSLVKNLVELTSAFVSEGIYLSSPKNTKTVKNTRENTDRGIKNIMTDAAKNILTTISACHSEYHFENKEPKYSHFDLKENNEEFNYENNNRLRLITGTKQWNILKKNFAKFVGGIHSQLVKYDKRLEVANEHEFTVSEKQQQLFSYLDLKKALQSAADKTIDIVDLSFDNLNIK